MSLEIHDDVYRNPRDLWVTPTPLRRVMVVGSCLVAGWRDIIQTADPGCPCDFFLTNNVGQLPECPPHPIEDYDFQLVQLALRTVLPDASYFRLTYSDVAAYEQLFADAKVRLGHAIEASMRWNSEHGLLTFFCNFLVPQQNPMGRLLPRYDLRNMLYFVEKLNEALADEMRRYRNCYLFDFDQIVSSYGRKYFQDDAVWHMSHAAALSDADFERDQERLEKLERVSRYYPLKTGHYVNAAWNELVSLYRTICQVDMVKLVVMDIDDTLWRGVAAEKTEFSASSIEGWPLGLAEALGYLKRRGVLLALLSKNDEERVKLIWNQLVGPKRLSLDDFAIRKINWRSKVENFDEILKEANLLPRNVVFIDDNPVERASITAAYPEVRTFGPNPYLWRRILLWSPETQVANVTVESSARTEMIQAQVERETRRKQMSRDEFLASLGIEITLFQIDRIDHPSFPRAFELINKTNQFNTTGKRWTQQECLAAFVAGTQFFAFNVKDKFTEYGLVGVLVVADAEIVQFVMSCRVIGMEVEAAVVAEIVSTLYQQGASSVTAALVETELNLLCRDIFPRCGFISQDGRLVRSTLPPMGSPRHIRMLHEVAQAESAKVAAVA